MKEYRSFQFTWILLSFIIPIMIFIYYSYEYQLGNNPVSLAFMIILESVFFCILLLFYGLQITMTEEILRLNFGIGLIRKRIKLEKVKSTELVKNPLHYGLGIKIIPNGMLYNAHGLDAVELTFKDKNKIIRIGSPESKRLKMEIDKRLK